MIFAILAYFAWQRSCLALAGCDQLGRSTTRPRSTTCWAVRLSARPAWCD